MLVVSVMLGTLPNMKTITLTIHHPDPFALLDELAPLAPRAATVSDGAVTFDVDLAGSPDLGAVERAARSVARLAMREGQPINKRQASHRVSGRDRSVVEMDDVMAFACERGWLEELPGGGWAPLRNP